MISRRCLKFKILANFTITFGMLLQLLINENLVDYESIELKMNELDYATGNKAFLQKQNIQG